VDGDNETFPEFWRLQTQDIPFETLGLRQTERFVLSWNAYNPLTGLYYGNGGLKLWTHSFIEKMVTHEQTEGKVVDFCWDPTYIQLAHIYGYTRPYGSKRQAFTAGFREGVKMPLVRGQPVESPYELAREMYPLNLQRLLAWCSMGAHIPDEDIGRASTAGAMYGLWAVHVEKKLPMEIVSDLDAIREIYEQWWADDGSIPSNTFLRGEIHSKTGISIAQFGAKQSQFIINRTLPVNNTDPFQKETWPTPLAVKF
jgi:hypothetical protein